MRTVVVVAVIALSLRASASAEVTGGGISPRTPARPSIAAWNGWHTTRGTRAIGTLTI